jgi:hypothetical protein
MDLDAYLSAGLTWWYEPTKADALADARKSKGDIGGEKGIVVHDYWRNFTDGK